MTNRQIALNKELSVLNKKLEYLDTKEHHLYNPIKVAGGPKDPNSIYEKQVQNDIQNTLELHRKLLLTEQRAIHAELQIQKIKKIKNNKEIKK